MWNFKLFCSRIRVSLTVHTTVALGASIRLLQLINVKPATVSYLSWIGKATATFTRMNTDISERSLILDMGMSSINPASVIGITALLWDTVGSHPNTSSPFKAVPLITNNVAWISITVRASILVIPVSISFIEYGVSLWETFRRWLCTRSCQK